MLKYRKRGLKHMFTHSKENNTLAYKYLVLIANYYTSLLSDYST